MTNAAGNLVDLNGNQINGAFLSNHPGFPGFGADQRVADAGLHVRHAGVRRAGGERLHRRYPRQREHPRAVRLRRRSRRRSGPGSACYVAQAQYYNQAFATFFQRLAADGITPQNSLFVISSDEGDHVAGANVGRAIQPTAGQLRRRDGQRHDRDA